MQTRVYVDGRIEAPEHATLRVLDHGFLFGDSVYETLWWHRGTLIQAAEHWDRLEVSAARVYLDLQRSRQELEQAVAATLQAAGAGPDDDALVRLMVTRGFGPLGLDFRGVPRRSLVVIVAPAGRPTPEAFERGISAAVVERRRTSAHALDPRAKTGNYMNNLLALHEAQAVGADDALLLSEAGELAEATTSNVFLALDGALATPSVETGILEGTARRRILDLCARERIACAERRVSPAELKRASEVFLTSSVRGILPVTRLNGTPVGGARVGTLTRRLHELFEAAADEEARVPRRTPVS